MRPNRPSHRRAASSRAAAAALLALAIATAGCGDGANGRDVETHDRIPMSTVDYGARAADVGDPAELNRLANLYATLQRRFQAGDMAGVCVRVSASLFEQFPPGADDIEGSCRTRLNVYAQRLQRNRASSPKLQIAWLRIYDSLGIGGITATDDRGRRLRVPFLRENDIWKLQLGSFSRPDTLNGTLAP